MPTERGDFYPSLPYVGPPIYRQWEKFRVNFDTMDAHARASYIDKTDGDEPKDRAVRGRAIGMGDGTGKYRFRTYFYSGNDAGVGAQALLQRNIGNDTNEVWRDVIRIHESDGRLEVVGPRFSIKDDGVVRGTAFYIPTGELGTGTGSGDGTVTFAESEAGGYSQSDDTFKFDSEFFYIGSDRDSNPLVSFNSSKLTGAQGDQGAQGAQGATGAQGTQGDQGTQGNQGYQGDTGAQGAQGDTGAQGAQGDTGAQGDQGDTGAQGATGAQGDQGDQGYQGEAGTAGAQGAQGAAGGSAPTQYFYPRREWIFRHEVGELAACLTYDDNYEWIIPNRTDVSNFYIAYFYFENEQAGTAIAIGGQGPQGSQGTQGYQGYQGTTGDTGAQGTQGDQGTQGNQGTQGETGAQGDQGAAGTDFYALTIRESESGGYVGQHDTITFDSEYFYVISGGNFRPLVSFIPPVESISGFIESAEDTDYVIDQYAMYAYTVKKVIHKAVSGTATGAFKVDEGAIPGMNACSLSSSETTNNATPPTKVPVGGTLKLTISSNSSLTDWGFTIETRRD